MQEITSYATTVTQELLTLCGSLYGIGYAATNADKPPCPKRKKGFIRKGEKNFWCTAYKEGCDFKIWLEKSGKNLTDNMVKQLLTKGRTPLLKVFKSKAGNSFDTIPKLDENYRVVLELEKKEATPMQIAQP